MADGSAAINEARQAQAVARHGGLPLTYRCAALVNVTPVDKQASRVGVGFDVGQERVRLALSLDDSRALVQVLSAYLATAATVAAPADRRGRRCEAAAMGRCVNDFPTTA